MYRITPSHRYQRSTVVTLLVLTASAVLLSSVARVGMARSTNASVVTPVQDSAHAAAVVARFHAALAAGDSTTALSLLSDDVVILESGGVETRDDYRAHHLPGDIAFSMGVPSQSGASSVRIRGDVAWVSGTSVTQGDFRGRPINSAGAELVVLTRESTGWKIRAIHWSSRARRQ